MVSKAAIRAEAARLQAAFVEAGAAPVEADILLPADTLLDLYGEDIRARSYVTSDPLKGEQMLRPDFTVPVVQAHMDAGAAEARYTYAGEVFRRQEDDPSRASEYIQVGYELFGGADPAAADAEVFALFAGLLAPLGLRAATGDIGILVDAVRGLSTSEARKAALLRHIWRPRRFRLLLERFAAFRPVSPRNLPEKPLDSIAAAGPTIGLRTETEVVARIEALKAEAAEPPIDEGEVTLLLDLLELQDKAPAALAYLREVAAELPSVAGAVDRLAARLAALEARGIDIAALDFEASYGRTTLEYYDGFVFGFTAERSPALPPIATGGRYDALTRVLGQGRSVPAVGGVIRPGIALSLAEAAP